MIDLYAATNTNYEMNGNMELLPLSCIVRAEINSAWTLELLHPIDDDGRWQEIVEGAVVKVRSFNGNQLFRIKQKTKMDGGVKAIAEPIFLDSIGDCFNFDVRPTNATGSAALTSILSANNKYSGSSNISIRNTAYYVLKNAMECIAGSDENSFLNRWGGEIEYNNFEIKVNSRIGQDNGIELLYGKNIPVDGMQEQISIEEVATRVVPKASNGRLITSGNKYVDSPLIGNYPTIMTKVVEYPHIKLASDVQGEEDASDIICNTESELNQALRNAASEEFSEGNIDKPQISITCDMILLQNTDEYKDFRDFESVSLGDTIHCKHTRLGIISDARIVAIEWNCLTESPDNVTIGSVMPNYLDRVASSIQATEKALTPEGDIIASQINGFIDGAKAQLRIQNSQAVRQDAIAILFEDTDTESQTFGALALGTQGLQVSKTLVNGEWDWGTAITSEGIIANYVVAGLLSDKTASNYWNLDTGKIVANDIEVKGDIKSGSTITGSSISGGTITGTAINNGNGTFEVDASGNLKAASAEITGDIKSGSTITGSTISGSLVTTAGEDTNFNYTSSLDNGIIVFNRNGKSSSDYNAEATVNGMGVKVRYPKGVQEGGTWKETEILVSNYLQINVAGIRRALLTFNAITFFDENGNVVKQL